MIQTRRDFISTGIAAAAMGITGCATPAKTAWKPDPDAEIWAAYLPFGRNMWMNDRGGVGKEEKGGMRVEYGGVAAGEGGSAM